MVVFSINESIIKKRAKERLVKEIKNDTQATNSWSIKSIKNSQVKQG